MSSAPSSPTPFDMNADFLRRFKTFWNNFVQDLYSVRQINDAETKAAVYNVEDKDQTIIKEVAMPMLTFSEKVKNMLDDTELSNALDSKELILNLKMMNVGEKYKSMTEDQKKTTRKHLQGLYVFSSSIPASIREEVTTELPESGNLFSNAQKNSFLGSEMAEIMDELSKDLLGNTDVQQQLGKAMETEAVKNIVKNLEGGNPMQALLPLIGEITKDDSPVAALMKTMTSNIEARMADSNFQKKIEGAVPTVLNRLLGGGAEDNPLLKNMMNMFGGAGAGGANPMDMLTKMMGGLGTDKKEEEEMPDLDDIANKVRKDYRKEYREAMQREALRKKLEERRAAKK